MVRFENVAMRYGAGPRCCATSPCGSSPARSISSPGRAAPARPRLLRLIYLAERPSRGLISLFDQDMARAVARRAAPLLRRKIGIVFQDFRLIDHLSAFDNVALPLRVAGVAEARIAAHVTELLEWVGLADQLDGAAARPCRAASSSASPSPAR